jgi:predicted site-specific integrase-resolvase
MAPAPPPTSRQWLSRKRAAELLDVNVTTLDAYVRRGLIARFYLPAVDPGREDVSPRFRIEDLEDLLAQKG